MTNLELVGQFFGEQFITQQMFTRKIMGLIKLIIDLKVVFAIWFGGTAAFYVLTKHAGVFSSSKR